MSGQKRLLEDMLSRAGIRIDGGNPWDMKIGDGLVYTRLFREKNLGLGETYMDGLWTCDRLDEFFFRILKAKLDSAIKGSIRLLPAYLSAFLFNPQSRRRSRRVAEEHYDRGTDLFMSFLDPYNQYSCASFNGSEDLHQAQINKMDLVCKKIELNREDRLLDIGCGWGGFARYAAERYGCSVTGVNISAEQVRYAEESSKGLPVKILNCEYRDIQDSFTKIASIGMFEHVGRKNYRTFMEVVNRCMTEDGIFLLQTIGGNSSHIKCDPWITKYIFPNSMLPSIAQIGKAAEGLFVVEDWQNIGPHYDRTLMLWNDNFQKAWPRLKDRYNERFKRMWEYYLLSCAGAFRARHIQTWQIVMTKTGRRQPCYRRQWVS